MPTGPAFAALIDLSISFTLPPAEDFSDSDLLDTQRQLAEVRRRVDAFSAAVAGQIGYRSRRELGYGGLAQRAGARTPELLVQRLAGTRSRESHTMVRIGGLMDAGSSPEVPSPLGAIGAAVAEGQLSLDAADAIRSGLSRVDAAVPVEVVTQAVDALLRDAGALTVEKLAARAREVTADLDEQHIADREQALRDKRSLKLFPQSDGMTRLIGLLDPESAAAVTATFDAITSPRRGGPRFVDPAAVHYAEQLTDDTRETEQVALDAFVELLRLGASAAPEIVGAQRPAVRVIVTDHDLHRRAGYGQLEGQPVPVSIATIERALCEAGTVPIQFDADGQIVNVGREQRLFTRRQKIGLSVRDGGCRFPGCDKPPSWTEAHHIDEWKRDGGRTDIADGVLLCRFHHLLVHNNHWRVTRQSADYFLIPPRALDPAQTPIPAPPHATLPRRAFTAARSNRDGAEKAMGERAAPAGLTMTATG